MVFGLPLLIKRAILGRNRQRVARLDGQHDALRLGLRSRVRRGIDELRRLLEGPVRLEGEPHLRDVGVTVGSLCDRLPASEIGLHHPAVELGLLSERHARRRRGRDGGRGLRGRLEGRDCGRAGCGGLRRIGLRPDRRKRSGRRRRLAGGETGRRRKDPVALRLHRRREPPARRRKPMEVSFMADLVFSLGWRAQPWVSRGSKWMVSTFHSSK